MLLLCKLKSKQKEVGNSESKDNTYKTYKTVDADATASSSFGSRMGGGANVMKLE